MAFAAPFSFPAYSGFAPSYYGGFGGFGYGIPAAYSGFPAFAAPTVSYAAAEQFAPSFSYAAPSFPYNYAAPAFSYAPTPLALPAPAPQPQVIPVAVPRRPRDPRSAATSGTRTLGRHDLPAHPAPQYL